jgi:hypothetical protein
MVALEITVNVRVNYKTLNSVRDDDSPSCCHDYGDWRVSSQPKSQANVLPTPGTSD